MMDHSIPDMWEDYVWIMKEKDICFFETDILVSVFVLCCHSVYLKVQFEYIHLIYY